MRILMHIKCPLGRQIRTARHASRSFASADGISRAAAATPSRPRSRLLLAAVGISGLVFSTYTSFITVRTYRDIKRFEAGEAITEPLEQPALQVYDENAEQYDDNVDMIEWVAGITRMRRRLAQSLTGNVVEIAAGTGRNLAYYDMKNLKSVVLVDGSAGMLNCARDAWSRLVNSSQALKSTEGKLSFVQAPLETCGLPEHSADSVFETMGLCSYEDPDAAIDMMARLLRPGGKLVLLEHGRASWPTLLNRLLDTYADGHFKRFGCRWNRDIAAIVNRCPRLQVECVERHHFGTTYVVIARAV